MASGSKATLNVKVDQAEFDKIEVAFARRITKTIARVLIDANLDGYDFSKPARKELDLIGDLAFNVLLLTEDQGGFVVGGTKYFPQCWFAEKAIEPDELIAPERRSLFHGQVDDDLTKAVLAELEAEGQL